MRESDQEGPMEIALVGDLTESETEICDKLLEVEPGGQCTLYFDSPGGSPYSGLAVMSLILMRGLRARGVVAGECSSAALWPLAACSPRLVTPLSVLLFHRPKWQSEENVGPAEASQWARHFTRLEDDMDAMLAKLLGLPLDTIRAWSVEGRYVSGPELAEAGAARLVDLEPLVFPNSGKRGKHS